MLEELSLEKAVDFAIETEKLGHHLYSRLARQFKDDKELGPLFETLSEDEVTHQKRFLDLRQKIEKKGPLQYEQQQYLRAVSLSDIFSGEGAIAKNIDQIKSREDALERAFRLEKTTLHYYQAMNEVLQEDILDEMIKEEKQHLTKVMQYMMAGAKMRGLGDDF